MTSQVGFFDKLTSYFKRKQSLVLEEDVVAKTKECDQLFDTLQLCCKKHGWNDNACQLIAPKYEQCVHTRDELQA